MVAAAAASLFAFAITLPATFVRAGTGTVHPGPLSRAMPSPERRR